MKILKRILLLSMCIMLLISFAGCGAQNDNEASVDTNEQTIELIVSAAASLTDAMDEIKTAYETTNENVKITYTFGSSGSLQQQIENGAPADVFVSAATKQMDALMDKGLIIEDTRKEFLENKIVLIVNKNNTAISDFDDLKLSEVKQIALGEPESVPAGQYADEVLKNIGIFDDIKSKAVYGKDVKEVLTWVETENADAGMVYSTDAKISDEVKVVATAPEGSHKSIYYPGAVVKDSENVEAAKEFVNFLYSSEAKPIFEKYGFVFID